MIFLWSSRYIEPFHLIDIAHAFACEIKNRKNIKMLFRMRDTIPFNYIIIGCFTQKETLKVVLDSLNTYKLLQNSYTTSIYILKENLLRMERKVWKNFLATVVVIFVVVYLAYVDTLLAVVLNNCIYWYFDLDYN